MNWWPKPQTWSGSGLDFGAWAPLAEGWYSARNERLNHPGATCVRSRGWKANLKFQSSGAAKFLTAARSLAESFIKEHRL